MSTNFAEIVWKLRSNAGIPKINSRSKRTKFIKGTLSQPGADEFSTEEAVLFALVCNEKARDGVTTVELQNILEPIVDPDTVTSGLVKLQDSGCIGCISENKDIVKIKI